MIFTNYIFVSMYGRLQ